MSNVKDTVKHLRKSRNEERKDWPNTVETAKAAQSSLAKAEKERVAGLKPMVALSEEENEYFRAVAEYMDNHGMLEVVDTMMLTMLARNIYQYRMAQSQLTEFTDYFQTHSNGAESPSVALQLSKMAEDQLLKIGRKLGLSPNDRAALMSMMPKKEESNEQPDELLG